MKKLKVTLVSLLALLVLVGCASAPKDEVTPKPDTPAEEVKPETPAEEVKPETETPVVTEKTGQDEFILNAFNDQGFDATDKEAWIVNEEGPNKTAVIIKDNSNANKPLISKIVYLKEGDKAVKVLYMQVENNTIIDNQ